jgi:hypothetical protein
MIINIGHGHTAVWNGGHYINEFDGSGNAVNTFSFAWEQNKVTQLEALQAFLRFEMEVA